jgi:hypothetical protein
VLRDHEAFRTPLPVDLKQTLSVPVPDAWKGLLPGPNVEVVPLVKDPKANHTPGWCTYTYEHEGAPELEVLCGGVNSKTPKAGAVWRQGNLLHFGFDLSPAQMNEAGQALLVNAVAYISRFTEDRPIVHTPCVFVQDRRIFDRGAVGRLLARPGARLEDLEYYLAKEEWQGLRGKERQEVADWYRRSRDYLRAGADGRLGVDAEARAFGIPPATPDFLSRAVAALDDRGRAAAARALLARYVPDGPDAAAPAGTWQSWCRESRPYLFFSDTGGYRWYTDSLAKKRGVPTAQLRGPARATRTAPLPR